MCILCQSDHSSIFSHILPWSFIISVVYYIGWILWPPYLNHHSIPHIGWFTTTPCPYVVIAYLVDITIYRTYVLLSYQRSRLCLYLRHTLPFQTLWFPVFSPITISAYNFLPIFFHLPLFWTRPCPYFQQ